ncbi:hypothetical protein AAC387_Pa03g1056 [Persea americana]
MEAKMTGGNQSPTTKQRGEYEDMVMMGNGNEVSTTRTGDYRKNGNMMSEADKASASKTAKDVVIEITSGSDGHGPSIYQSREEEPIVNIPRVPEAIRRGDNDAYEPKVISFGPYHRGNHRLQPMEKLKWENLQRILDKRECRLSDYLDKIAPMENRVRSCYSDDIKLLKSRDLVEMMLLDSCFIIHFVRGSDLPIPEDKIWIWDLIYNDMLLLENQLPLFLVEYVFHLIKDEHQRQDFTENALDFFSNVDNKENPGTAGISPRGVRHLFHLYHKFLFFGEEGCTPASAKRPISGAKSLEEWGIEFRTMTSKKVMDVKFNRGTMEIKPLRIDASNISLFKNLIALERLDPCTEPLLTGYAMFMDYIIDTSKDVALLRKKGIIIRAFGSDEEVATIFNQLTGGAMDYQPAKVRGIYQAVEKYCRNKHRYWLVILLRDYFSNPWTSAKVFAAVILLVLAFIQTFFSMYSYFRPPSAN